MADGDQEGDLTVEGAQDSILSIASDMAGVDFKQSNGDGDDVIATPPAKPPVQAPPDDKTPPDPNTIQVPTELLGDNAVTPPATGDDIDLEEINKIDVDQIPEPMRPNFAKMRDKLNGVTKDMQSIIQERDTLKQQLESSPKTPEEVQQKFQEREKELLDTIAQLNIERHPEFIRKYENQRKPVSDSITNTLSSYNIEGLNVDQAVQFCAALSPAERVSYLQGQLPEEIQQAGLATLLPMFSQLDMIEANRKTEIQNHQATATALEQQATASETAQLLQIREEAKQEALQKTAENEFLLKTVDGNEDWNKMVKGLQEGINTIFASTDPKVHAQALVESQLMPVYKLLYLQEQKRAATFEKAIRDRNIALPTVGGKPAPTGPQPVKSGEITADRAAGAVASKIWG